MQALFTNPSTGEKVSFLYQWETDIDFSFEAKNGTNVEVAFSTIGMKEAIRKDCANTSGDIWTCKIPDTILQYGTNVAAYITYISGNSVRVIDRADITVKKRKKPAGYVSTTDDTWITVEQMLERIEASTKNVETIENNVKSTETEVRKLKEEVEGKVNDFSSVFDNCVIEFELIRQHAVEDVNAAGTTQINAINTAGSEQKKAVEDAGQEALNNIGNGVDSSLTVSGKAADAGATGAAIGELKSDLVDHVKESQKAIEDLNDKKITKFYANSLGETTLNDSDKGKIQDMILYGKSVQDGIPTHDAPVEIQSVVNPVVTLSDGENSKTAILPYTLNAIAVPSDGNITIDGQLYKADYVDIERKKLVRMIGEVDLGTLRWSSKENLNSGFFTSNTFTLAKGACLVSKYKNNLYSRNWENWGDLQISHNDEYRGGTTGNSGYNTFIIKDTSLSGKTGTEVKQTLSGIICYYELATPTETDLTDEEVQAFKELATYYPTTNVMVTSDQLDGFTTFDYPISMANGWNYVKEQLGDTREYIYDMDLQSAEAYVNSEYAVTLTELEV